MISKETLCNVNSAVAPEKQIFFHLRWLSRVFMNLLHIEPKLEKETQLISL